jgi:prephenate dehydrogenase
MTTNTTVTAPTPIFNRGLIIGCGLIGGSLGHGLVHHRLLGEVQGYDANPLHAQIALEQGLIDAIAPHLEAAAAQADIIILAVPVGGTDALLRQLGQWANPYSVIVDTGSVKQLFAQQCEQHLPAQLARRAIPCHPIAGHVSAGPQHANRALMAGRPMIMTPNPDTDPLLVERVAHLWQGMGFNILEMTAQEHDAVYADLSHMPHFLAFTLMQHLHSRGLEPSTLKMLAGNALKDMTHHAGQNASMWRDIFRANRQEICRSLANFRQSLDEFEQVINDEHNEERLLHMLKGLQQARLNVW